MLLESRATRSGDGVNISYSVSGTARAALVFIHGGLADRSFWDGQFSALSDRFTVIALDLAGHGESGRNRARWGIPECASDVAAIIGSERLQEVILVGNSLGGAVAIETAALAGTRVLGVVGVDTFHDLSRRIEPGWARKQAEEWRRNFDGTLDRTLRALFHSDVAPSLLADVRRRMARTPAETVWAMFCSLERYDTGVSARQLRVPVRCINGDLFPTNTDSNRKLIADFDAVVLPRTGHFPMLECPEEFNRRLTDLAAVMTGGSVDV